MQKNDDFKILGNLKFEFHTNVDSLKNKTMIVNV